MSFGPELTVSYASPKPGTIDFVRMAPFTSNEANPLFPFPKDDPALPFIAPVANFLRAKTAVGYMQARILPPGVVGWGIWDASRLLGFLEMARKEGTDDVVSLSIVLEPNARGRGAGPLAVAGALHCVCT